MKGSLADVCGLSLPSLVTKGRRLRASASATVAGNSATLAVKTLSLQWAADVRDCQPRSPTRQRDGGHSPRWPGPGFYPEDGGWWASSPRGLGRQAGRARAGLGRRQTDIPATSPRPDGVGSYDLPAGAPRSLSDPRLLTFVAHG